ncbi:MAG: N-acetyltransferase [Candidatus Micrarchaeota archaeon]|nr:N-acetyltransferase [Candidatus Micrarchaeota archaeon]
MASKISTDVEMRTKEQILQFLTEHPDRVKSTLEELDNEHRKGSTTKRIKVFNVLSHIVSNNAAAQRMVIEDPKLAGIKGDKNSTCLGNIVVQNSLQIAIEVVLHKHIGVDIIKARNGTDTIWTTANKRVFSHADKGYEIAHDHNRFWAEAPHGVADLRYSIEKGKMVIEHLHVPEPDRGNGIGAMLVNKALSYISATKLGLKTDCEYIKNKYLRVAETA